MAGIFTIKHDAFEGPLDLLLDLIEKRKLFINDISLAQVADDYIAHIKNLESFPIADSANFVLIASTLVLIKSKSLLPALELSEEEGQSIDELERRLKLYKRMKELSVHIKKMFGHEMIFQKSYTKNEVTVFAPSKDISLASLIAGIRSAIASIPKKEFLPKIIVQKVVSLEEMISRLTDRIKKGLQMSFKQFAGVGKEQKVHVIVSFLAMLELVKQGIIMVQQEKDFGDIHIEPEGVDIPRYG